MAFDHKALQTSQDMFMRLVHDLKLDNENKQTRINYLEQRLAEQEAFIKKFKLWPSDVPEEVAANADARTPTPAIAETPEEQRCVYCSRAIIGNHQCESCRQGVSWLLKLRDGEGMPIDALARMLYSRGRKLMENEQSQNSVCRNGCC